ncbi:LysR family transcriptional regulator [Lactobacillus sp. CBA3606]|uniref:LysR family transcriptional regulator n=1 Tax=Lactobacillus sp. CBA3606 TaxID=2099789 RepID=UPI000CFC1EC5|nr:LysR family transcriptional regulator [Lactobacillus sp. CBA3606]AVK63874.1 LysR family transcriptional regulator [Lactobacillus sp. CBA3606]
MNERDLKYFCSLVETGNYTATAKQFQVTQPAISVALKRLETKYATKLLTQSNHRARLVTTSAGQVLYIKARHLIKEFTQIELEVQHAGDQKVRLGFSHIAGGIWLPRVIETFAHHHLLASVTTEVAISEQLLEQLRHHKLDAAIFSTLQPMQSDDLQVFQLETHPLCVLANIQQPISRLQMVEATDLQQLPIIARLPHSLPRTALTRYCSRSNVRPKIIYEAHSNQLVESLVARNLGIGFVINGSVALSPNVVKIPLKPSQSIDCYMQLAVRKSFLPNAYQTRCIDLLKEIKVQE